MARGSSNKKLLEPLGCQESSEQMHSIGPVMANSIASYSNCVESVARARHQCIESSFTSSEMETIAKLSGELPGVVPVRAAKGVGVIEEIERIADVLCGE